MQEKRKKLQLQHQTYNDKYDNKKFKFHLRFSKLIDKFNK
jgi:hypothetical protein